MLARDILHDAIAMLHTAGSISDDSLVLLDTCRAADDVLGLLDDRRNYGILNDCASLLGNGLF